MHVIKIGGRVLDDPGLPAALAAAIARLPGPPVIVHGGGAAIAEMQARLGIEAVKVEGQRVSDAASRDLATMVLSGLTNERLVGGLVAAGLDAQGMSGVDRGLLRCVKREHPAADLGFVGRIVEVRAELLRGLLAAGVIPVLSPISLGEDGQAYNVNADDAAATLAAALGAERLDFLSDVPGVLVDGAPRASLSAEEAGALLADGTIEGGMALKVRAALAALARGVRRARIVDLAGLAEGGTVLGGEALGGGVLDGAVLGGAEDAAPTATAHMPPELGAEEPPTETESVIAMDADSVLQTYVRPPLVLTRGEGAWLWDAEGRRYLDFQAGIAVNALGHADPDWVEVVRAQAGRLTHVSNLHYTAPYARLARRLVERSFADRVYFANTGAEAIESAIKFARRYQGAHRPEGAPPRHRLVAFERAFHGRSMGAVSMTYKEAYRAPFAPLLEGVTFLPFDDVEALAQGIDEETCAVFVEPVQGEGGYHPASPDFLTALRRRCDETGALLVLDEIQCGLGRTGRLWAHEWYGVEPDMMAIAKPLAGGLPIGATLMRQAVADAIRPGDHGSTFAGGPLVCRAAELVLDRVAEPAFLAEVRHRGGYLAERLRGLGLPQVLEVRGLGLMVGVDLDLPVKGVIEAARERGLLIIGAGTHTLRLCPPLIVDHAQIDLAVETIGAAVREAARAAVESAPEPAG